MAVLLVTALAWLNSRAGGQTVRALLVENANKALKGELGVQGVELDGDHLILRGLTLRDPEGNLVAEIDQVEAAVSLPALLDHHVVLRQVRISRPRLYLKQDERGLNLARALALRHPKPEEPKKPSALVLRLKELELSDGGVDFEETTSEAPRRYRLEGLAARGRAAFDGPGEKLEARLSLDGRVAQPLQGPLSLAVDGSRQGEATGGNVQLRLPGLELDATANLQGTRDFQAEVRTLRLDPSAARTFLPEYPLQVPASLAGKASRRGDVARVDLQLSAGSGRATVKGSADLVRRRADGLSVQARDLDLSQLLPNAPKTALALDLRAQGGGTSLDTLDGAVTLSVSPSKVQGQPMGPVRLEAQARAGQFRISELIARLPGLSLTGTGRGNSHALFLSGKLDASDLGALARAAGRLTEKKTPELTGSGALDFKLEGPPAHPALNLNGSLSSLEYRDGAIKDLSLSIGLADIRKPLEAQGELKARRIQLGERTFEDVLARLQTKGRQLQADLSTRGLADIVVHVDGVLEEDQESFRLSALALRYPEVEWTLQAPARVRFGEGHLSTEPLRLAAGEQRLTLSGSKQGTRLSAALDLEKLELRLLPRAFVAPSLGLAGQLDAHVQVQGTSSSPVADARLTLRDGAFQRYTGLGLTLEGRYAQERARGRLSASSPVTTVDANFDVPVRALERRLPEPLKLQVDVHELKIEDALAAAGREAPFSGRLQAQLVVTGTAREPLVRARLRGRDLHSDRLPPKVRRPDFDLVVESGPEAKLGARLDLETGGGVGVLSVRTPYTVAGLRERRPTPEELRRAPIDVDLDLREVDLALLEALRAGPAMKGRLSMRLEARGSATTPTANLQAVAEGLALANLAPTRVELGMVAGRERLDATLEATRSGRSVARLVAALDAPFSRLLEEAARPTLPLRLDGTVGPLALSELQLPAETPEEKKARPADAMVSASLSARGTLSDPRLQLRARLEEVHLGNTCVGAAAVDYDYAQAQSRLKAAFNTGGGGTLTVDGQTRLDLSWPALQKGLDVKQAPLALTLAARRFDVSLFNGLLPKIRAISGQLRADGRLEGTLGTPAFRGQAEWTDGRMATMGYGEFQQVHLLLDASNDRIQVKDLSAVSGGGSFRLVANLEPGPQHYVIKGAGDFEDFPIVYDDQLRAVATLQPTFEGELNSTAVTISRLTIPEAHVVLPEVRRKDLQELDRPEDILLWRNGHPADTRRWKRLEEKREVADKGAPSAEDIEIRQALREPEEGAPPRKYTVAIVAPGNLWVRGTDINAEVGLSDGFSFAYQYQTFIKGDLLFLQGRVEALGRKFTIQKDSVVRFQGPASKPYVDLTANYVNDREQVKVTLAIRGEGRNITVKPSSEPPLSESEIYTLLATGRTTLKRGSGASRSGEEAASIVGTLAASQLKKTLAAKVPLDVLSVEAGGEGGTFAGTRLEAGTYLTDKLYVGYTGRIGANPLKENSNAVKVEYQLSPRISGELEYGDARVGGLDLIWSRDY